MCVKKKNNIFQNLSRTTESRFLLQIKLTFAFAMMTLISFKLSPFGDHLKYKIYY
jgi:hypothetical protein